MPSWVGHVLLLLLLLLRRRRRSLPLRLLPLHGCEQATAGGQAGCWGVERLLGGCQKPLL
jgi:hypothetical protein